MQATGGFRMQQYTPPTVIGVRSADTCHPLQKCRSGCVANINIYIYMAGGARHNSHSSLSYLH